MKVQWFGLGMFVLCIVSVAILAGLVVSIAGFPGWLVGVCIGLPMGLLWPQTGRFAPAVWRD